MIKLLLKYLKYFDLLEIYCSVFVLTLKIIVFFNSEPCSFLCNLIAKVYFSCRIFITKLNVYIQHKLHINTLFPFPTFRSIFNTHTAIQQAPHNMQIIHGRYNANTLSYHTTLISQTSVFPLFIFSIFVSKRSNK